MSFKHIRIITLLVIFIGVAHYTYRQTEDATDWDVPLQVNVYPIAGDDSPEVKAYITKLKEADFAEIDEFFEAEAEHYQIHTMPVLVTQLHAAIDSHPPARPLNASITRNMLWSLRVRSWAYWYTPSNNSPYSQISLYAIYHKPEVNKKLPHSSGLMKGLLGIGHLFATTEYQEENNIVLSHELLHTLGASDKYDENLQPIYPSGFANSKQTPLYPQEKCEIMAGRIATTKFATRLPDSLQQCVIGKSTAVEINWV